MPAGFGPFNGATAFRRWKPLQIQRCLVRLKPSMGPPHFRRWKQLGESVPGIAVMGPSMGPPPFGDGNKPGTGDSRYSIRTLQWGHRLSAMETRQKHGSGHRGLRPSMGPPPFGDGNKYDPLNSSSPIYDLQWGHRLSAMETALCGSSAPWIHAKALFSTRIGYRINGHSVRDQLGFAAP